MYIRPAYEEVIKMRMRIMNGFKRIYDNGRIFAGVAVVALVAIGMSVIPAAQAAAATSVTVDGDPREWAGIDMQTSTDAEVAKWAVMQDDDFVYF